MQFQLQDIDYIDIEFDKINEEATEELSRRLGKPLYPASPERILLLTLLDYIIQDREFINDTGKMQLLAYARGDYLDHLGALMEEKRFPASRARTTLCFTLSTALDYVNIIPKGTRAKSKEGFIFQTLEEKEVPIGQKEVEVLAECDRAGVEGNGIAKGSITTIVDVFPYFNSVTNTTMTYGGAEMEDDDHFRQRIHEAPEKFSCAGPDGAYHYYAMLANPRISDVAVWSPEPGKVNIVPLLEGGEVPEDSVLDDVKEICNGRYVRPLTDYLEVKKPRVASYTLTVKYWISEKDKLFVTDITKRVEDSVKEFTTWQRERLGRDINPSRLINLMVLAGAKRVEVESPIFQKLEYDQVAHLQGEVKALYQGVEDE